MTKFRRPMKWLVAAALLPLPALAGETAPARPGVPAPSAHGLDYIEEKNQDEACSPLQPGESQVYDQTEERSSTGVVRKYRVSRPDSSKRLQIDLNLQFFSKQWRGKDVSQRQNAYFDRAQACFDRFRSRLRDKNGWSLEIRLTRDASVAPVNRVEIKGKDHRADSESWNRDIDCPTIIHESLHLMGLCDGYEEKWMPAEVPRRVRRADPNASRFKYDCRHKEPDQSVMSDHWIALNQKNDVLICRCRQPSCPGTTFAEQTSGNASCPAGYVQERKGKVDNETLDKWTERLRGGRGYLVIATPAGSDGPPALLPAHTAAVARPHCFRDNPYHRCAENSYRTRSEEGCAQALPECRDGRWMNPPLRGW